MRFVLTLLLIVLSSSAIASSYVAKLSRSYITLQESHRVRTIFTDSPSSLQDPLKGHQLIDTQVFDVKQSTDPKDALYLDYKRDFLIPLHIRQNLQVVKSKVKPQKSSSIVHVVDKMRQSKEKILAIPEFISERFSYNFLYIVDSSLLPYSPTVNDCIKEERNFGIHIDVYSHRKDSSLKGNSYLFIKSVSKKEIKTASIMLSYRDDPLSFAMASNKSVETQSSTQATPAFYERDFEMVSNKDNQDLTLTNTNSRVLATPVLDVVNKITDVYLQNINALKPIIYELGLKLFYYVLFFATVINGILLLFREDGTIQTFLYSIVRLGLIGMFCWVSLMWGPDFGAAIVDSFTQIIPGVNGTNPSDLISSTLSVLHNILDKDIKWYDIADKLFNYILAFCYAIINMFILCLYIVSYFSAIIFCVIGSLAVVVAPLPALHQIGYSYLLGLLGCGLHLLSHIFIIKIFMEVSLELSSGFGDKLNFEMILLYILSSLVILTMSATIPPRIAGLVANVGGIAGSSRGSAMPTINFIKSLVR